MLWLRIRLRKLAFRMITIAKDRCDRRSLQGQRMRKFIVNYYSKFRVRQIARGVCIFNNTPSDWVLDKHRLTKTIAMIVLARSLLRLVGVADKKPRICQISWRRGLFYWLTNHTLYIDRDREGRARALIIVRSIDCANTWSLWCHARLMCAIASDDNQMKRRVATNAKMSEGEMDTFNQAITCLLL